MDDDGTDRGTDSRMSDLTRDLPEPKNRGLFRRNHPSQPIAASRGAARLRVVAAEPEPHQVQHDAFADDWEALETIVPGRNSAILNRLGNAANDPVAASFDHLRTSLLKALRANGWNRVAITSPTMGCGTTFSAINLAMSLAQIPGSRTLLMDLYLRLPGLARALDMKGLGDMKGFLAGHTDLPAHIVRASDTLVVGLTQAPDEDAAHLLNSETAAFIINDAMDRLSPDVMLCDLPPVLEHDDLAAFLPQVDGVLLVADGNQTLPDHIAACERFLENQTRVMGVILNQARLTGPSPMFA